MKIQEILKRAETEKFLLNEFVSDKQVAKFIYNPDTKEYTTKKYLMKWHKRFIQFAGDDGMYKISKKDFLNLKNIYEKINSRANP